MKKIILIFIFSSLLTSNAFANNSEDSLFMASLGSIALSTVPIFLVSGVGELVVVSVTELDEKSEVVIESLADGSKGSILVAGHLSYGAGQSVDRIMTSAGTILSIAGKVIAFIPTELGQSLIYQAQH